MALPGEPGSKESGGGSQNVSKNSGDSDNPTTKTAPTETSLVEHDDRDFDPTAEALIDEIDDERTLEEEEALGGNNVTAVQDELDDLKKESEMPIEELLAYYERMRNEVGEPEEENADDDEEEEEEEEDEEFDEEDDLEKQQQQQQNDPSLTTPPQLNQQLDSSLSNTNEHTIPDSVVSNTEREKQQPQRCELIPIPTGSELNVAQQRSSSHNVSANDVNAVSSSGRHKHSMTEFLIDHPDSGADGMFKTLLDYDLDDSDDLDEDYSYTDDENDDERNWRRVIHVGPEFQAEVPDGLSEYESDLPPYEPEDKLVWRCNSDSSHEQIIDYLKRASLLSKRNDISISPASVPKISDETLRLYKERMFDNASQFATRIHYAEHNHENISTGTLPDDHRDVYMSQSRKRVQIDYELEQENAMDDMNGESQTNYHIATSDGGDNSDSTSQDARPELSIDEYFRDEEQLLFLLLQCNYNFEEALRRRRLDPYKYYIHEPMSLWSQEECLGFEHGLRIYGKDFRSIRENKVQTRTHSEIVAFYYLWKKSERHDVYTNQYKLDRKRSLTHPGTTDYMDKFIEDNESALNAPSTSPTPTPTESTVEINQIVESSYGNNSTLSLCHSSGPRPSAVPCMDAQVQNQQLVSGNFNEPNQAPIINESEQNSSVFIDSSNSLL